MNLLFYVAFLLLGTGGGLIGTSIPYLTTYFNVPPEQAGLFVTVQTIGGVIATVIMGRWLDRLPSRRVVWVAQVGFLISGVLMMIVNSWIGGLLAMFVFGAAFGSMLVIGSGILTRLNLPHPASALNLSGLSFGIGATVGPQIIKWILVTQPISVAYLVIALLQVALLPFMLRFSVPPPPARTADDPPVNISLVSMVLFGAFLFVYTGAEIGFSSWISTHMINVAGVAPVDGASFVSLFWFGITSGRLFGSLIAHRFSDETILIAGSGMVTLVVAFMLAFGQITIMGAVATFLFGFCCGPIFPSTLALVGKRYPEALGKISGGLMAVGNFGVAVIPWLQGQVSGGMHGGYGVTLVLQIMLLGLAVLIARDTRRAWVLRRQAA